jgi:hypothetical protein
MFLLLGANTQAQPADGNPLSHAHYSVDNTTIHELLDDPASRAVLQKDLGIVPGFQADMVAGMTLKQLQQQAPEQINDQALAKTAADLANLSAVNSDGH